MKQSSQSKQAKQVINASKESNQRHRSPQESIGTQSSASSGNQGENPTLESIVTAGALTVADFPVSDAPFDDHVNWNLAQVELLSFMNALRLAVGVDAYPPDVLSAREQPGKSTRGEGARSEELLVPTRNPRSCCVRRRQTIRQHRPARAEVDGVSGVARD